MARTPGDITPIHILKEIKRLWLAGLSTPRLAEHLQKKYPGEPGLGKSNIDGIIQRLKTENIQSVSKITQTETTTRPVIVGKNQAGLPKAQEILNNPKKRKIFENFANKPGVTLTDIRKRFNISSIHETGLRNLIDRPASITADTAVGRQKALDYLKRLPAGKDINVTRIANATDHTPSHLRSALNQPEIKAKKFNFIPIEGKDFPTKEKFKELYKEFEKRKTGVLRRQVEVGDAAFAKVLNEAGYKALDDQPWSAQSVGSRRRTLELGKRTTPTRIDVASDVKKYKINTKGLSQEGVIQKIRDARKLELLKIQREDPAFRDLERKRRQRWLEGLTKEQKQQRLEKIRTSGKTKLWGLVPVDYYHPQNKGLVWRDLVDTALKKQKGQLAGSHIKFLRKIDPKSLTSIPKVESLKLVDLNVIDPKTGKPKIITYENVFRHIDKNKALYGIDSKKVINEYGKKRLIQLNPKLKSELNTTIYGDRYDPTSFSSRRFTSPGVIHHTRGRANNSFNVQFAIGPENKRESELRRMFDTEFKDAKKSTRGKVNAMKKYLTSMKQEIPNIEVGFKKTSYGKRELMPAMIQRAAGTKLKNQLLIAAKTNAGGVCNIFRAEGGRIGYAAGSSCVGQMTEAFDNDPVRTTQQINKIKTVAGKVKDASLNFLKLLGRGGARAAPFAALAAVGAGIEPLVKQFVADDPSTYLTDESQMIGMLLATIEGETPKVDEEILKWQLPALGAATAAGAIPGAREAYLDRLTGRGPAVGPAGTKALATIPEKPVGKARAALGIKGVLGKALGATFSPLAVAATTPLHIAAQRKEGTEWGDIATDPSHWFGPAFASSGYQMASKGITNPTLLKALRLGISPSVLRTVSSRFGLPGLMISGGMWGYDKWKNRSVNDPEA